MAKEYGWREYREASTCVLLANLYRQPKSQSEFVQITEFMPPNRRDKRISENSPKTMAQYTKLLSILSGGNKKNKK